MNHSTWRTMYDFPISDFDVLREAALILERHIDASTAILISSDRVGQIAVMSPDKIRELAKYLEGQNETWPA